MGEIADYMLNGDDCEGCGEYLGRGDGFPRRCASCSTPQKKSASQIKKAKKEALANISYAISKLITASIELHELGYEKFSKNTEGLMKNLDSFHVKLKKKLEDKK